MSDSEQQVRKSQLKKHLLTTAGLVAVFTIIILVLLKGLSLDQSKIPSTIVGKNAYPFRAEWIQGQPFLPHATSSTFTLEHLKGRLVILNFWASWCVSCKTEARELEQVWQEFKDHDVLVVGIAIQDTQEAAQRFAHTFGKTYILGLDVEGRISIDYGVTGVPETFIINPSGIVIHKEIGPVTVEGLKTVIAKFRKGEQGA